MRSTIADPTAIEAAAELLQKGNVVAFATDTAYGLGADPENEEACRSIYRIKGRLSDQPLILLGADFSQLEPYAVWTPIARKLAEHYWPGPLTLILPALSVGPWINAGGPTIGLRVPGHETPRMLADTLGRPLATTSANRSGESSPRSGEEVLRQLGDTELALLLDGGTIASCTDSTILMLGEEPRILREGSIPSEQLLGFLPGRS